MPHKNSFDGALHRGSASSPPNAATGPDSQSWQAPGRSRLDSLRDYVTNSDYADNVVPWRRDYSIQIHSQGGAQSLERERIAIVGHAGYGNCVEGHRATTTDSQTLVCDGDRHLSLDHRAVSSRPGIRGVERGRDTLHVEGDAKLAFGMWHTLIKGEAERTLEQPSQIAAGWYSVVRSAGMFTRACGGASLEFGLCESADVHGGTAMASIVRIHIAALGYQSMLRCRRAYLLYCRAAPFTITPCFGAQPSQQKRQGMSPFSAKYARLKRVVSFGFTNWLSWGAIAPVIGLIFLTIQLADKLATLIGFLRSKPPETPPARPPVRVQRLTAGLNIQQRPQVIYL